MSARTRAARPGRNELCPCGSGKKFKRCHIDGSSRVSRMPDIDPAFLGRRQEAARIQRERQQGLGKPIISATLKGERFVAVRNRMFHSERFRTFHDFLMRYIMAALGPEWGTAELRRPGGAQHPVAVWYQALCRHQRKFMTASGQIVGMPYSGAAAAFLQLAYDLYSLDHNAELQNRLVARLRNPQGFPGARYETYVAAIFIRAGFDLVFENEEDGSTTHCEFTATDRRTGKKFSVEAKRREGKRLRFGRLFNDALYTFPLTPEELDAYRRHPDTFFGVPAQRKTRAESLIEFYDFCFESYRQASKETLLGSMKTWPDQERLAALGQPELASLYAESIALAAWREKDTAGRRTQGERGEERLTAVQRSAPFDVENAGPPNRVAEVNVQPPLPDLRSRNLGEPRR